MKSIIKSLVLFLLSLIWMPQTGVAQSSNSTPLELISEKKLQGSPLSGYVSFAKNSKGDWYVLDSKQMKVFKYNNELVQVSEFGGKGSEEGKFEIASDIHIDEQDDIYISDPYLRRITVFDTNGAYLRTFDIKNQAVDMVSFENTLCTHTGGAKPSDDVVIHCYDKFSGEWKNELYRASKNISRITWGFSNVTFQSLHLYKDRIVSLSHPFEGFVHQFDTDGNEVHTFQIRNERFDNPQFPENYNVMRDVPFHFTDSLYVHGIHILENTIHVIFVEHVTGNKYLDVYDMEGERKIPELIFINYQFPVFDDSGFLYAIRHAQEEGHFNLIKYRITQ